MEHLASVSHETILKLKEYQELLLKWNKKVNLVCKSTIDDLWNRHILDSLQLIDYINDKDITLIDVGSGAGFPGVVLSIAGIKNVILIESDVKKSIFLTNAAKISNNPITILNERVEELELECDILTCRAFASVDKMLELSKKIRVKNKYLLLKGKNWRKEIVVDINLKEYTSITNPDGRILEIYENFCCS